MYLKLCKPATVTFVSKKYRAIVLPTPRGVYSLIRSRFQNLFDYFGKAGAILDSAESRPKTERDGLLAYC
jgi:hypothetical protein